MAEKEIKNVAASVRNRLLKLSRASGENYNAILLRFFQERFLARLSQSAFRERFILKGGLLLLAEHATSFRPTVDIDMLGIAISNDPANLLAAIKEIAELELNDGVRFDAQNITYRVITEDEKYQGLRFSIPVHLGKIRSSIRLDVGFKETWYLQNLKSDLIHRSFIFYQRLKYQFILWSRSLPKNFRPLFILAMPTVE